MYDVIYDIEYDIYFSYHMIFINLKIAMNLRLPSAARKHKFEDLASACFSGALPLGIEPIVVLHQDGSYGCRWMGSRCRQRAP